jgi:hypothetical protein
MYDYLDRPVEQLDGGSRFVLNAMRVWVDAVRQRICPPRALLSAIPQPELCPAVGDLHRTMLMLHHFGSSAMPFGELDNPSVTEGEAIMLTLWASVTADQQQSTRALLEHLVSEAATAPMEAAMVRAAACLSVLGLAPAGRLRIG